MAYIASPSRTPELFVGLVAPIGVDLNSVTEILSELLRDMDYRTSLLRLTTLMKDVSTGLPMEKNTYVASYKERIAYANAICNRLGHDALAAMAVSAIRATREQIWEEAVEHNLPALPEGAIASETPVPSQVYIIRQLKRPEEVQLLRNIYGRQFILVSAYSPQSSRIKRIEEEERKSQGGLISEVEAHNLAYELVSQDTNEAQEPSGQNVRDAFPLGDVFIDATSKVKCRETLRRFVELLFGSNSVTPTHDEYGMYIAKSASLRSSDLSRQVGAAIFSPSGTIATMGCNEVPKAGGGTYWPGDEGDDRDFVQGYDPNESYKLSLLVDLIDRLKNSNNLSEQLHSMGNPIDISKALLTQTGDGSVKESKLMDLIEFWRIIHAEMSAISDAARKGIAIQDSTLYCTTFPCHICAKHIVASGVRRVVYLEPYPKSYASALHDDSIEIEGKSDGKKVSFEPFRGVSPYRYRDLFEKGKRKATGGAAVEWNQGQRHPMIDVYYPSYSFAEITVVGKLDGEMEALAKPQLTSDMPLPDRGAIEFGDKSSTD
jgi:deoxycytidylate deaminase